MSHRIIKFLFILIIFCCVFACEQKKQSPHVEVAYKIINIYSEKEKKNGLSLFGSGGFFSKSIEKFSLDYLFFTENMNVEESRKILVKSLESFFEIINHDKDARPFIVNFPYNEKNIYFVISFLKDVKTSFLKPDNIASVTCSNGNIYFSEFTDSFKKIHTETYAEAYEKVYGVPLLENRFN